MAGNKKNDIAVRVKCTKFNYSGYETAVLHDVDFTLEYGRVTLLSGMSGCGKSTLISLINGIIPRVTAGEMDGTIEINGENVKDWSMSRISRRVGTVLQNADSQIIHKRVEDEIAFGCENFAVPEDEIEERISRSVRLMKLDRDWQTRTLSGGQKQRLVTASTLAMDTDILIFDEPLANLDCAGAVDLLGLLKKLSSEGKAVLLVEHRLDMVLPYVDEVWKMQDGTVERVEDRAAYFKSQINVINDGGRAAGEAALAERKPFLDMKGVRKSFGKREILKDITAEIHEGERILLLGENGCGKSTLLNIIGRLLARDGGEMTPHFWEGGANPYGKKKQDGPWFRTVGVIYQNPDYQLFMPSVREEILFGSDDEEYALSVASRFGLDDLLERHPQSLSEGQKRKVTVAAILAQKPKFLLLDEPTVGQDYEGLKNLLKVVNEIHLERHNTMISVSHDFRCADALCDRVLMVEDGKIVRDGGKELIDVFFRRNM